MRNVTTRLIPFIGKMRKEVLLLHFAFVIMLIGASVTHFTQVKGTIHLRQGEPMAYFLGDDDKIYKLDYQLRLDSFYISYKEDGKTHEDYTSIITVLPSEEQKVVSMNNIMYKGKSRFYQTSFDEDMRGSILTVNRDPWGIPITYTGYLLMGLTFLMILWRQKKELATGLLICSLLTVHFSLKNYDMPVLNTWLLPVHVSLIITAYILFPVAAFKRSFLNVAEGFLAMGIFIGAYWANISWGDYWSWDPKETWALITMLIYAVPIHSRSLPWFRNKTVYRTYVLMALLSIAMTYFGVNYLLGGMHSYGA